MRGCGDAERGILARSIRACGGINPERVMVRVCRGRPQPLAKQSAYGRCRKSASTSPAVPCRYEAPAVALPRATEPRAAAGSSSITQVPPPLRGSTRKMPPSDSARRRMPKSPRPDSVASASNPTPSSLTAITVRSSPQVTATAMTVGRACRTALLIASAPDLQTRKARRLPVRRRVQNGFADAYRDVRGIEDGLADEAQVTAADRRDVVRRARLLRIRGDLGLGNHSRQTMPLVVRADSQPERSRRTRPAHLGAGVIDAHALIVPVVVRLVVTAVRSQARVAERSAMQHVLLHVCSPLFAAGRLYSHYYVVYALSDRFRHAMVRIVDEQIRVMHAALHERCLPHREAARKALVAADRLKLRAQSALHQNAVDPAPVLESDRL